MKKERLETISDGVLAIITSIMVLGFTVPHGTSLESLRELTPTFLSYILSFTSIAIYWNNHHNLLHIVQRVNGTILWANMHLLFWLSLVPFATSWMEQSGFSTVPVAAYAFITFGCAIAYYLLTLTLVSHNGENSTLALAIGRDYKGKVSGIAAFLPFPLRSLIPKFP